MPEGDCAVGHHRIWLGNIHIDIGRIFRQRLLQNSVAALRHRPKTKQDPDILA
jgi:hypothetical protein